MKKVLICALCLLLFASCARQTPELAIMGEESETVTLPDVRDIVAAETLDDSQITCTAKLRDGETYGFEMRFLRTPQLHTLFADAENLYYGVVSSGSRQFAVPMEQIRILTDEATHEFVITLLLPGDETVSGGTCTVSFYVASREGDASQALFCAQKSVEAA